VKIRFHLDENVHHAIARGCRRRGIDITTSTDAQLVGTSDVEQFTFVLSEQRVLVRHDPDFLRPEFTAQDHPGIVYNPHDTRTIGEIVRYLSLMFEVLRGCEQM
jgi:hypothetical protein